MKGILRTAAAVSVAAMLAGCGMDSAELGEQVRKEMQAEFSEKSGLKGLVMETVRLIPKEKGGMEYAGIGKGKVNGERVEFDVRCKYDGSTVLWTADLTSDSLSVLSAREKTDEALQKLKAAWPGIKAGLMRRYEVASAAAKEVCGEASRKFDALCKEAKEDLRKEIDGLQIAPSTNAVKSSESK